MANNDVHGRAQLGLRVRVPGGIANGVVIQCSPMDDGATRTLVYFERTGEFLHYNHNALEFVD